MARVHEVVLVEDSISVCSLRLVGCDGAGVNGTAGLCEQVPAGFEGRPGA
jgi:hypothetical protein